MYISKIQIKFEKTFLVFEIIAFEPVAGIYHNYDENRGDRQSASYQSVLGFRIWQKRAAFQLNFC